MKKYRISEYDFSMWVLGFCFGLACIFIAIYAHFDESPVLVSILFLLFGVFLCVCFLYTGLSQFMFGSFCVDDAGITMNIGSKKYYHPWEKIADYGFNYVYVDKGGLYWLYFSERFLSPDEKRRFLQKTRKDLNSVAFFQYNEKTLQEILPYMPESVAEKLREEEKIVKDKMTWLEKKYH